MQDRSSRDLRSAAGRSAAGRSAAGRSAAGRRSWKAPLLIAGALLFALTACESLPRNDNWSMFDREQPSRAGS